MAKIKPMALIESMSKKVCMHSDVYFRTNKKTGAVYSGKLCNPSQKPLTESQEKAKRRFAKVSTAVRTILEDPEQRAVLEALMLTKQFILLHLKLSMALRLFSEITLCP